MSAQQMESKAERNRRQFPETTALVDRLRKLGFTPKVTYACENGREIGKRPEGWAIPPTKVISVRGGNDGD